MKKCSQLTIKILEQCHSHRSDVFIVNFRESSQGCVLGKVNRGVAAVKGANQRFSDVFRGYRNVTLD